MKIELVGVLGAGVMGTGVAQNLAQTGYRVVLLDTSPSAIERAREEIKKQLRFRGLFQKQISSETAEEVLGRINFTTDYGQCRDMDYVIENVPERREIKQDVYRQIDSLCPAHCIFASNTSAIPITQIAAWTERPEQVIGTHFMNPVPMKKTVEVIRGSRTSEKTLRATTELLTAMSKESIVVKDSPGFVSNRVLMLTINEAIRLVEEGVASAEQVDQIFKSCFGHQMGPLETADLIGLDTIQLSLEVLQEATDDSKYCPCQQLKKMVDAGLYGQKSGQGFYTYPGLRSGSRERQGS